MIEQQYADLSAEAQLALAHTPRLYRDALRIFLELDARLARIVAGTSEPMLGQMRLAWWRDMLSKALEERPQGDKVLDGIGAHWAGHEAALVQLIDAWELMLGAILDASSAVHFASGRSAPVHALIERAAGSENSIGSNTGDLMDWAYADAAVNISNAEERELLLGLAHGELDKPSRFPRALRGLAVLSALAKRSIRRGGRPLMEGRGAALTAIRAAMLGR